MTPPAPSTLADALRELKKDGGRGEGRGGVGVAGEKRRMQPHPRGDITQTRFITAENKKKEKDTREREGCSR